MTNVLKLAAVALAVCSAPIPSSAAETEQVTARFIYDRSVPVEQTYRRAIRTASKACKLNGRVAPIKRSLRRTCVRPLVEQFIIKTGNRDLIAHHEARTGQKMKELVFVMQ